MAKSASSTSSNKNAVPCGSRLITARELRLARAPGAVVAGRAAEAQADVPADAKRTVQEAGTDLVVVAVPAGRGRDTLEAIAGLLEP